MEYLLGAKHCAKRFTHIIAFNAHNNRRGVGSVIIIVSQVSQ